jgi:hypothetical protein
MTTTHVKATLVAFVGLLAVSVFTAAPAGATFGGFTLAGEFVLEGEVSYSEALAVDESTGNVYVYNEGTIYQYDADGNAVNFSALGTSKIVGVGNDGGGEAELAVDNSPGPAKGDIYLTSPRESDGGEIKIFAPDGESLGQLTKVGGRPWGEACGVAVDGAGNVYVGLYPEAVDMYTPTGSTVTDNDYVGSHGGFGEICHVAADGEGRVYARSWTSGPLESARVVRLDRFQAGGTEVVSSSATGTLTAANASNAEVFLIHAGEIRQYNSAGDLLSAFGQGGGYVGLAFDAKRGKMYASSLTNGRKIEAWQGFATPEVRTLGSSGASAAGDATVNGSVSPEGETIESCSFDYGLTEAYGSVASCDQSTPLTGTSVLPVSAGLTGLTLNHTYHYRLAATDAHGTIDGSDQAFAILVAPSVEDQQPAASEVTRSTAVLSGAVDPHQGETRAYFEYGPGEDYGYSTPVVHSGDLVSGDVPVTRELIGLIPSVVYHYRLVAVNVAGTTYGADHTFTSGEPAPPGASTGAATEVAQNTATIMGTVNTNGLPSSYGFEIATSTDYGPPTGLGYVGAGSDEAAASLQLTGLVPGTTYHYRLTVRNVDGTVYGADRTFTTSVYASTFAEPPAPLPFVSVPSIAFPGEPKSAVAKKKAKKVKKRRKAKGKKKPKSKQK